MQRNHFLRIGIFLLIGLCCYAKAAGDSFFSVVPTTAKGYMYCDFSQFKQSEIYASVIKQPWYASANNTLKEYFGLGLENVEQGVLLLFSDRRNDSLVIFRGSFSATAPSKLPGKITSVKHGKFDIYSFFFNGKQYHLTYPKQGMAVFAQKRQNLDTFLKTFSGKEKNITQFNTQWPAPVKGKLLSGFMPGEYFQTVDAPFFSKFSSMFFQLSAEKNFFVGTLSLGLASAEAAESVAGMLPLLSSLKDGVITIRPEDVQLVNQVKSQGLVKLLYAKDSSVIAKFSINFDKLLPLAVSEVNK